MPDDRRAADSASAKTDVDGTWAVAVDGRGPVAIPVDLTPDLRRLPDGSYHYLSRAGLSVAVDVLELDTRARTLVLRVDGRRHEVDLLSPLDRLLDAMGMEANPQAVVTEVTAPMPGLVLRAEVAAGDRVAAGTTLLVLEAMKMENAIKAPAEATVASVEVAEGQAVEKGAVLVRFEVG